MVDDVTELAVTVLPVVLLRKVDGLHEYVVIGNVKRYASGAAGVIVYVAAFLPVGVTALVPVEFWIPIVRVPEELLTNMSTVLLVSYNTICAS